MTTPPDDIPAAVPDNRLGAKGWANICVLSAALVLLTWATGPWGLVMVLGLVVMIVLHELGHFLMAKRAGMQVTEFFLGFGPRLWSFRRGETEYGLKLVPAGAYVRIVGMTSYEEVPPEDEGRTYRAQPFWQRFGVAVAGSTMHFLQALAMIFVVLVFTGASGGAIATTPSAPPTWSIDKIYNSCPAKGAGLHSGDRIVSIDGHRLTTWDDTASALHAEPDQVVDVRYERNGQVHDTSVHLGSRYDSTSGKVVGTLGIEVVLKVPPKQRTGVVAAVPKTFREFGAITHETVKGMGQIVTPSHLRSYGNQVVNAQRDADSSKQGSGAGPTTTLPPTPGPGKSPGSAANKACAAALASGSVADGSGGSDSSALAQQSRLTSVIGIFHLGKGLAQGGGVGALLIFFALINIFIGLFNLFPALPFDGGHVVIAVYEKVQEWRQRSKGRYFADVTRMMPLTYGIILVLGIVFVSSLYLDFVNPISVGK